MTPEMVDWFNGYSYRIPNLTLNEFRDMLIYKTFSGFNDHFYKNWEVESLYMECQGNYTMYHHTE